MASIHVGQWPVLLAVAAGAWVTARWQGREHFRKGAAIAFASGMVFSFAVWLTFLPLRETLPSTGPYSAAEGD